MKRRERQTAKLLSVSESVAGTTLSTDAAPGATTLYVDDVSAFDESGWLMVGSQVVKYTAIDDDAGTVTLATALTDAAETDDLVARYSKLYGEVETVLSAQVAVLGDRDQGDELTVEVADTLDLPLGDRGGDGENCTIESDGDAWTLIHASGRPSTARGIKFESAEPAYSPTDDEVTAGVFTRQLLHTNIAADHGFFTTINGVAIGSEWWALDAAAGIVTVTLPSWIANAVDGQRDFQWPMYAYRRGLSLEPPEIEPLAPVPFTYVGRTTKHGSGTSIAFPAGTQVGDLAVLGLVARTSSSPAVGDGRFTVQANKTFDVDTCIMATAIVSNPSTPVVISLTDLGGVQEADALLYVIRPEQPINFVTPPTDSGSQAPGAGSVPGMTGVSGAVGMAFADAGLGGTFGWTWPSPWTSQVGVGTYARIAAAANHESTIAACTPTGSGASRWRGLSIGLGLA